MGKDKRPKKRGTEIERDEDRDRAIEGQKQRKGKDPEVDRHLERQRPREKGQQTP